MSTEHTGADTLAALEAEQHRVEPLACLRDVDTLDDVLAVADRSDGRFAALARALYPVGVVS